MPTRNGWGRFAAVNVRRRQQMAMEEARAGVVVRTRVSGLGVGVKMIEQRLACIQTGLTAAIKHDVLERSIASDARRTSNRLRSCQT